MVKRLITVYFISLIIFSCKQENAFKIVLLQDTQHYSESFPEIFYAQIRWIAENRDSIAFVLQQGDLQIIGSYCPKCFCDGRIQRFI